MNNLHNSEILSHKISNSENFDKTYQEIFEKIKIQKLDKENEEILVDLLGKVKNSEMLKFLVEHSGFNGYWTEYMCSYPETKQNGFTVSECSYENYIMENFPIAIATQTRYQIFKNEIKKLLQDNISIASLPCGLMNDILSQNFSNIKNFKLHGIDLDQASLDQARAIALSKGLIYHSKFTKEDAWEINYQNEFDLFVCNGLNIYVNDDEKIVKMYEKVYKSLKENGIILTSTLVPPPSESPDSTWKMDKINPEALKIQVSFLNYFMKYNTSNFKTPLGFIKLLEKAGFKNFEILPDALGIFVTIRAQK